MGRFLLTPAARRDLANIAQFIHAQNRPLTAKRIGAELRKAARKLADMPGMGHTRDDIADESLRFWTVYSFVIAYRPDTKPLQIVRVLHGARDLPAIFGQTPSPDREP